MNVETAWLEIIETAPGKIELRRETIRDTGEVGVDTDADAPVGYATDEAPLLRMEFSRDAQALLGEHLGEVARTMIAAGIQAVSELYRKGSPDLSETAEPTYTLH